MRQFYPERLLVDRSQHQSHDRAGDREPMISARQAAEALFAPKRQLTERPAPSSDEPVRKPRVLSASPTAEQPRQEPLVLRQPSAAATPEIPKSQFARIRALQRYGMSARQLAEVYESLGRRDREHPPGGHRDRQPDTVRIGQGLSTSTAGTLLTKRPALKPNLC